MAPTVSSANELAAPKVACAEYEFSTALRSSAEAVPTSTLDILAIHPIGGGSHELVPYRSRTASRIHELLYSTPEIDQTTTKPLLV